MIQELVQLLPDLVRLELLEKLGLSILLGGAVGLERELLEKPAGLRTNILICVGSALFTDLSLSLAEWGSPLAPADPSRIAAQVVSGIGFLGAGAIIQSRVHVRGLTTAATIWVVAAIGMAVGTGAYAAATLGAVAILLVLVGLGALERRIEAGWTGVEIMVRTADDGAEQERVLAGLRETGLSISLQEVTRDTSGYREIRVRARMSREEMTEKVEKLFRHPEVTQVRPR